MKLNWIWNILLYEVKFSRHAFVNVKTFDFNSALVVDGSYFSKAFIQWLNGLNVTYL